MWKFENLKMKNSLNFQISKFSNFQIIKNV